MLKLRFSSQALTEYTSWMSESDKKTVERIDRLIDDALNTPFSGIGKPEPLKYEFSGSWSRRIDKKNRLVYSVNDGVLEIESCRYHYKSMRKHQ